jgi:hypothetical protein
MGYSRSELGFAVAALTHFGGSLEANCISTEPIIALIASFVNRFASIQHRTPLNLVFPDHIDQADGLHCNSNLVLL